MTLCLMIPLIKALMISYSGRNDELTRKKALKINEVLSEFLLEAGIILVVSKLNSVKIKTAKLF